MKMLKLIATSIALSASVAEARSIECTQGVGANGYSSGYWSQHKVIENLWTNAFRGECYEVENFISAVQIPYASTGSTSGFLRCRDQGILDGMNQKITNIMAQCEGQFIENGQKAGLLIGQQICNASSCGYYTLRSAPIRLASLISEQACKANAKAYVNRNCPSAPASLVDFNVEHGCSF